MSASVGNMEHYGTTCNFQKTMKEEKSNSRSLKRLDTWCVQNATVSECGEGL